MNSLYKVFYLIINININTGQRDRIANSSYWYTSIGIAEIPLKLEEKFKGQNVYIEIKTIEKIEGHL